MQNGFVFIAGLGIYRRELIRKVVPFVETDYRIEVTPPINQEGEFNFKLIKAIDVVAAIYIDGEEEPLIDDFSKTTVSSSIDFTRDEILAELYGDEDEIKNSKNKKVRALAGDISDIKKKTKNYKIRLRSIEEHQVKLASLDAARGSPNYNDLVNAINENAPNMIGQSERVVDVTKLLNDRLDYFVSSDSESVLDVITQLDNPSTDIQVSAAAQSVLEEFHRTKILGFDSFEDSTDSIVDEYDPQDMEDAESRIEDRKLRLAANPPEQAIRRAEEILESGNAITNRSEEELDQEEATIDESDEDDEENENEEDKA